MTEPADLAHDVLLRVAAFVRTLPTDQLEDLARGDAKLELVPKGGRVARTTAAKPLPRPAEEIIATVQGIGDRAAARRYLEVDLKLTVGQLQAIGEHAGITVPKSPKPRALDAVVEYAVGRRLDSDSISRAGGGR